MLKFLDIEPDNEVLLAGLKPLPINRMLKQAGRRKMKTGGGKMLFSRHPDSESRIKYSAGEVQRLLRSDPQFKASYEKQVIGGKRDDMTDKYRLYGISDGSVLGAKFEPHKFQRDGKDVYHREPMSKKDVNDMTMERLIKAQEAINNFDPIEASAKEDYNRLKGGRRGPAL